MTSTPHFALAQHPETGEWLTLRWSEDATGGQWLPAASLDFRWFPTPLEALQAAVDRLRHLETHYPARRGEAIATLDRLIAIERDLAAGDEAQVQTIRALDYHDRTVSPFTHGSEHDPSQ